jgi:hypothetical protein
MRTTVPTGLAEQTEIEAYADFAAGSPDPIREALGIGSLRVGSALALAIREDPSCFFNRAGGFGAAEPVTADVLVQACGFYRDQRVPKGAVMIAPPLLPPDWAATADKLNLTKGSRFTKLGCTTEAALSAADGVTALHPGLRVGPVEPRHAHEWAMVIMTTFGFTPALTIATRPAPPWRVQPTSSRRLWRTLNEPHQKPGYEPVCVGPL